MCEQMTGTVVEIGRLAGFASPELRGLFAEWLRALESEIIAVLKEKGSCSPVELADQLKLSEESIYFLLGKLVREEKLKITGISP
ncbi:MAG: winged helix-turn-helix transcriptional regulator [Desulfobacca sp.]